MKYIHYIIVIILTSTIGIWSYLFLQPPPASDEKVALVVNDREITVQEIKDRASRLPYSAGDQNKFYDDIILRELIIQAALKAKINREEDFRRSIQDFYEQSLVKIFTDRKFNSLQIATSPSEQKAFRNKLGMEFTLTLLHFPNNEEAEKGQPSEQNTLTEAFTDLPAFLQMGILNLEQGQTSPPFAIESEFIRIRIDSTRPGLDQQEAPISDQAIDQIFLKLKRQLALNQWFQELRNNADVVVYDPAR